MQLVDTHCHIDFPDYKDDLKAVLDRAVSAGVVRMIVPGTGLLSSERAVKLAKKYPQIFAAIGIHPHGADKYGPADISKLRRIASQTDKVIAIGEIGLDNYKKYSKTKNQRELFRECLYMAKDLELPVIVHSRDAGEDVLKILREVMPSGVKGVVHCFAAEPDTLNNFLELGMDISFTGNITFNNADRLRRLVEQVVPDRLLLETDSPYITPVPMRGKRNEPAYVVHLLDVYAGIYNLTREDVARITTHNANRLFNLGLHEKGEIVYSIRGSLYLNITNRCTNSCTFCTRENSDFVKGHNLRLKAEPTVEELMEAMGDVSGYNEIVFCGYGEPTLRLSVIKEIASFMKEKGIRTRLTTNGEGALINGRNIVPELQGLLDRVSVSLNAPDAEKYDKLCLSDYGKDAYAAILNFISECVRAGIEVEATCLDMIGKTDIDKCRQKAKELGAGFRLRHLDVVG